MALAAIIIVSAWLIKAKPSLTTSRYEAADGWLYQCSKPLAARQGTATTLGHPQGLVPIDLNAAAKYCQRVGIE